MTTVVSILVSDIVPLRSRGTWQGVLNIVFASGAAVGGPLGTLMSPRKIIILRAVRLGLTLSQEDCWQIASAGAGPLFSSSH